VVFVNLATARSVRRALEVGVRKACGASRAQLVVQFLGESVLYVALAACLALALADVVLPYVNAFLDSGARLDPRRDPELLATALVGVLGLGVLAGAYPAFVLSAFRPSTVLKGVLRYAGGSIARQSLVVLQFAILIGLILTATVIYRQCLYATRDGLRVDVDQMLIIRAQCKPVLLNELRALSGVRGAQCSSRDLLDRAGFLNARLRDGSNLAIDVIALEFGAFGLYGIKPLAGVLPRDEGEDGTGPTQTERHTVINETAARRFGFASPAAAIGELLPLTDAPRDFMAVAHRIVAVVPDFSFDVAAQKVRPTLYAAGPEQYNLINVRLTGKEIPETLDAIDRLSIATGAVKPLERFFVNEYIQGLYLTVLREAQAFGVFAAVALVLAALGLLGLSAATAASRTREIGIRKAMGASTTDILRMLLWEFSTPILWASLLAWPVTGLLLSHWLGGFADHVELGPWPFLGASALALGIALLTVGGHAFLIARAKPVAALRYE
jgi:putative ABC transport system permease protein